MGIAAAALAGVAADHANEAGAGLGAGAALASAALAAAQSGAGAAQAGAGVGLGVGAGATASAEAAVAAAGATESRPPTVDSSAHLAFRPSNVGEATAPKAPAGRSSVSGSALPSAPSGAGSIPPPSGPAPSLKSPAAHFSNLLRQAQGVDARFKDAEEALRPPGNQRQRGDTESGAYVAAAVALLTPVKRAEIKQLYTEYMELRKQLKRFQASIQDAAAGATWMVAEIPTSLQLIEAQLGKTGSGTRFPFLNMSRRAGRAAGWDLHR